MYAYNPSTTEAETRGSEVQGQPEVNSETVSKTQMNKGKNSNTPTLLPFICEQLPLFC